MIGELTGLTESDHRFRVYTGAGDYLLQVAGLPRNGWTYHENCLWGVLGTGINSLSFQGMNPATGHPDGTSQVFVGIKFNMRDTGQVLATELNLRMKNQKVH